MATKPPAMNSKSNASKSAANKNGRGEEAVRPDGLNELDPRVLPEMNGVQPKSQSALRKDKNKKREDEEEDRVAQGEEGQVAEAPEVLAQADTGEQSGEKGGGVLSAESSGAGASSGFSAGQIALGALALGGIAAAVG